MLATLATTTSFTETGRGASCLQGMPWWVNGTGLSGLLGRMVSVWFQQDRWRLRLCCACLACTYQLAELLL
jgi:hypothetical protein